MRRIRSSSSSSSTSTFALTLALVVLLTLLSPLTSSLSPFRSIVFVSGEASSTSPTKVPTTISASVNSLFVPLIQKAYTAYTLDHPDFPPLTIKTTSGSAAALAAASTGEYDFVVATNSIPYANQAAFPSMRTYPLVVNSFAPFYNLPVDVVGSSDPLVLTSLVACQIWRKEITLWNDTRIQATNPTMTLPGQQVSQESGVKEGTLFAEVMVLRTCNLIFLHLLYFRLSLSPCSRSLFGVSDSLDHVRLRDGSESGCLASVYEDRSRLECDVRRDEPTEHTSAGDEDHE